MKISRKTTIKKLFVTLLAVAMVLNSFVIPKNTVHAATTNYLTNGSFNTEITGWTITPSSTTGAVKFGNWGTLGETDGQLSYWLDSDYTANTYQTISNLEGGNYKLTAYIKNGDLSGSAYMYAYSGSYDENKSLTESQKCTINTTATGDVWTTKIELPITVESGSSITLGFFASLAANNWINLDDVTLEKVDSQEVWDITSYRLQNPNFEQSNLTGWTATGNNDAAEAFGYKTYINAWSANQTNVYNAWNNIADTQIYTLEQPISNLEPGNYQIDVDVAGVIASVGSEFKLSAGASETTFAPNGWDTFQTVSTNFTVTDASEVTTLRLASTLVDGDYVTFDHIKLTKLGTKPSYYEDGVESSLYVKKVDNLSNDFIMGADISTVIAEENSGVKYYNTSGQEEDIFKILGDAGVNYIRVRVWNDPYADEAKTQGYGAGNCDINTALTIAERIQSYNQLNNANMKLLVDFHYSDFWADPGKQKAPKAWATYTLDERATAIANYTTDSLNAFKDRGLLSVVGMVQIGNETNNGICGTTNWTDMSKLFKAGCDAVTAFNTANGTSILKALHFTNPEKGIYSTFAQTLQDNGVDYDVFASSYYPFWHGTLTNLTSELKKIAVNFGKKVMVAETSYAFSYENGDGNHGNVIATESSIGDANYTISPQGQANSFRDIVEAVSNVGENGIGVFYWEPAWVPVKNVTGLTGDAYNAQVEINKSLWEQYGSGWASSYVIGYDTSATLDNYGGSEWDNQALFDFNGKSLESVNIFKYVRTGTTATPTIEAVENSSLEMKIGETLLMPSTVNAIFTDNSRQAVAVNWNAGEVSAIDTTKTGTYTITGSIENSAFIAKCVVSVLPTNLVQNPGLEDADTSMWELNNITGSGVTVRKANETPKSGSYCTHFYSANAFEFTLQQTITGLTPGKYYNYNMSIEGGNADGSTMYSYAVANNITYKQDTSVSSWQNWSTPEIKDILVGADGTITIGIHITCAATGAWGTLDDFYLYLSDTNNNTGNTDTGNNTGNTDTGNNTGNTDTGNNSGNTDNTGNTDTGNNNTGNNNTGSNNTGNNNTDNNNKPSIPSTNIEIGNLSNDNLSLGQKESFSIATKLTPNNSTDKLSFKSSNPSVASINAKGIITAKNKGTTTITVTTSSGVQTSFDVTVLAAPKTIAITKDDVTIKTGKTTKVKYTLSKNTASNNVKVVSKNSKIASASIKDGYLIIKGKAKGTTVITIKTYNNKYDTIKVTIK